MKNKFFGFVLAVFFALFMSIQSAFALIYSDADIYQKIDKLNVISNTDFISFINKADMVGYRLAGFEMTTSNYKNYIRMTTEQLSNISTQIQEIRRTTELSETDKNMQISKMYQDATTLMFNVDNQTMNYLISLNQLMPTITYARFIKTYQEFYNGLNITNSDIKIK